MLPLIPAVLPFLRQAHPRNTTACCNRTAALGIVPKTLAIERGGLAPLTLAAALIVTGMRRASSVNYIPNRSHSPYSRGLDPRRLATKRREQRRRPERQAQRDSRTQNRKE